MHAKVGGGQWVIPVAYTGRPDHSVKEKEKGKVNVGSSPEMTRLSKEIVIVQPMCSLPRKEGVCLPLGDAECGSTDSVYDLLAGWDWPAPSFLEVSLSL